MKLLVSPNTIEGAKQAILGGADIIDCKNPAEGSLGANFPWVISEMRTLVDETSDNGNLEFSATMGDMPHLPGTASLAATGLASLGVDYIKIGVYGPKNTSEASALLENVVKSVRRVKEGVHVVAAAYGDQARLGTSIPPIKMVKVAAESGCDYVMVDTYIKDDKRLVDFMSTEQILDFCNLAHDSGIKVALAGKLRDEDIPFIKSTGCDVIGVRSMVCTNSDRTNGTIDSARVNKLKGSISE